MIKTVAVHMVMRLVCISALLGNLIAGCASVSGTEVTTRAVPVQPTNAPQPGLPGQPATQLPTFPQRFDVQGPEVDSFGFAVTQPGPVVVDVQAQGAPVIVTLQSPGGQPIVQQAAGNLRMNYTATSQNVQRSLFWQVQVRLAQSMPPQSGGRATGMVRVQYPPVNQAVIQQAAQAANAQRRQPTDHARAQAAAQIKAKMDAAFNAYKGQFEQREVQRRASLMAQFQSQTGGPVRPRGMEEPPSISANEEIGTRAVLGTFGAVTPLPGAVKQAPASSSTLVPAPAPPIPVIDHLDKTQGQPKDRVTIYGKNFGNSVGDVVFHIAPTVSLTGVVESWSDTVVVVDVPDAPGLLQFDGGVFIPMGQIQSNTAPFRFIPSSQPPTVTALNVTQGQPGDPVMITGSGFGSSGGEVHFVVGPNGQELVAAYGVSTGVYWYPNQITASVPDASGLTAFNGFLYIVRYPDKAKSVLVPFRFNPSLELRNITVPTDKILQQFGNIRLSDVVEPGGELLIMRENDDLFSGAKGNDQFFLNTRLKNGWIVIQTPSIFLPDDYARDGGAYLVDVDGYRKAPWPYVSTNWPYMNVRFWVDGGLPIGKFLNYALSILIQGPKGVPDGVVVP